jgi:hypothetical protein
MNRRTKKFIRADVQVKIVFIALFVACLALLVNFQMSLATLWAISSQPGPTVEGTLDTIRQELVVKFLITVALTIPLSICVGILYSFRFCGPLYRFKKYFDELVDGSWETRCALRKGDDLWDICDSINAGMGNLREQIREDHQILQEAREVLDQVRYTVDEAGKGRIQALRERIDGESRTWSQRFPEPAAGATAPAPRTDVPVA